MFFQKEGKFVSGFVCVVVLWFFLYWVNKMVSLWSEIVTYEFDNHCPYAQVLSVHVVPLTLLLPAAKLLFRELSYWFV